MKPDATRLSGKESLVLEFLLAQGGEMYGLQLVQESGGRLGRGTVYVTLDRMEAKGLVESRQEDRAPGASGIARRLYRPTGYGVRVFTVWQQLKALADGRLAPLPA
jgi:PadR family transcriptional regulator, regulatory protein PadR